MERVLASVMGIQCALGSLIFDGCTVDSANCFYRGINSLSLVRKGKVVGIVFLRTIFSISVYLLVVRNLGFDKQDDFLDLVSNYFL